MTFVLGITSSEQEKARNSAGYCSIGISIMPADWHSDDPSELDRHLLDAMPDALRVLATAACTPISGKRHWLMQLARSKAGVPGWPRDGHEPSSLAPACADLVRLLSDRAADDYPASVWIGPSAEWFEAQREIEQFVDDRWNVPLFVGIMERGITRLALMPSSIHLSCTCAQFDALYASVEQALPQLNVRVERE